MQPNNVQTTEKKKIIFSAIQPSGTITLGNYLGAIKNWVSMQETFHCVYALADLHAITVRQDPQKFRANTMQAYALLLACGIDPKKSTFFIQSHVPTHAQLAWVLNCYTQFGELSRMTQFKDKSLKHADNVNVGLFAYPSLMAADILLYQADMVPVGADQKQHLELSRDIAARFNGLYGNTFKIPEPYIPNVGARVMSLQEPQKKMSKSDENSNAWIGVLDKPETIMKKFKRAVTDSDAKVCHGENKDGINNLIGIYSAMTGKTTGQIEKEFEGSGYGQFKEAVAQSVIDRLRPVQEEYERLMNDKAYLKECYEKGAQTALHFSQRTLDKAMKKIGFVAR